MFDKYFATITRCICYRVIENLIILIVQFPDVTNYLRVYKCTSIRCMWFNDISLSYNVIVFRNKLVIAFRYYVIHKVGHLSFFGSLVSLSLEG